MSATDESPEISVVVSTYRRARLLPRLVAALESQSLPRERFEVVIIDNASPDATSRLLADLAAATRLRLHVERAAQNRGPASGRNLGIARARGRYVAFTDDDCVPDGRWLERLVARADGSPRVVVGRTVPPAHADPGPFDRVLRVDDTRYLQTCNILYRREDLARLGGFDERIAFGEDTDLGLRAVATGVVPAFAPDALVVHDVRPRTWREAVRDTIAWTDLPLVVRRHPSIRRTHLHRRIFWKRSHPPAVAAAVGVAVAARRPLLGALLVLPWVRHRLLVAPLATGRRRRVEALPGAFAVDLAEVAVLVRGSVRHRTLML